jgi:hypothetical protein
MGDFIDFLQLECPSIEAFVEEFELTPSTTLEEMHLKFLDLVSKIDDGDEISPQRLKKFIFGAESDAKVSNADQTQSLQQLQSMDRDEHDTEHNHDCKRRKTESWSPSLRLAIIEHLLILDMKVCFLIDVVETYKFDLKIEEFAEIVRSLDILGATKRLSEYEALVFFHFIYFKAKDGIQWHSRYKERSPVESLNRIYYYYERWDSLVEVLANVGSQRLIEYVMNSGKFDHNHSVTYHSIFSTLCQFGKLSLAKWLYSLGKFDLKVEDEGPEISISKTFRLVCEEGHFETAEWLYSLGDIVDIHEDNDHAFQSACGSGHLQIAQWLYSLGGTDTHANGDFAFVMACDSGHLLTAKWLYSLGGISSKRFIYQMRRACRDGISSIIKWLHDDFYVPLDNIDIVFRGACRKNDYSFAQWLYNLGEINIHSYHDVAFREACCLGHLEIAQWLYSLDDEIDIHIKDDWAFRNTCANGYLAVAQWLYSFGNVNIHANNEEAFRKACNEDHLMVVQWLYSLEGFDHSILRKKFKKGTHVTDWITKIQET